MLSPLAFCAVVVQLIALLCHVRGGVYTNPVLPRDFPDPVVMQASNGLFYAYGTQSAGCHIQVAMSSDLVTWAWKGEALPHKPKWALNSTNFWAPDVQQHGDTFYMYFASAQDSKTHEGGGFCVGLATATSPLGPFEDVGDSVVCGVDFSVIDPKSIDAGGKTYLYWGSNSKPLMVQELSPDRKTLAPGTTARAVMYPTSEKYQRLIEGSWIEAVNGTYYLFFSGDNCCGATAEYAVMVARSSSPVGPFETMQNATGAPSSVMLQLSSSFIAPGHNSMVVDKQGKHWMFYHAIPVANFQKNIYGVNLCIQLTIVQRIALGFPIRTSPVITVHITLPTLFAD
eukprot:TRINITY_DN2918_c0_g1_i2.p1 TRINITY_DN2918_c0_g1~~TRINITY_DN2918_c0_g1_i2.p1  ORF type:complete len:351 (-),score=40.76 TRINITY_DN2918_c0_g1_i2:29-1051(-)